MAPTRTYTTEVPAPRDEVWQWFARPGAFLRLAPPFGPLQPARETESLRDGRAVLAPGVVGRKVPGPTWVAQHRTDGFVPGEQFVDEVTSQPYAAATGWRHVHRFEDVGDGTRVVDEVSARVPGAVLDPMFAYRRRQLVEEFAAQRRAQRWASRPRTVAITGASGLVGSALGALLSTTGHTVVRLTRSAPDPSGRLEERRWNPEDPDPRVLDGVDAVVHLAGEPIGSRFTPALMRRVRDSRVEPTRRLAAVVAEHPDPTVFVSASAIGYYGSDHGDEWLNENASAGHDFLAGVVSEWEDAHLSAHDVRTVAVRTGLVLSGRGGMLPLLAAQYRALLGGRLGDGRQWMSWIGLDDLVDVYRRAVLDDSVHGAVNAVAPNPVRNEEFGATLGRVLRRPDLVPVPSFGPKVLLGERGAQELALASQRVRPGALEAAGHTFRGEDLEGVLRHELGRPATS